jgi:predicted RNA binding protein YcfA (HicA-like mRNA interferase family)
MARLPRLRGGELIAVPGRAGFVVIRVRGSHHFLKHPDGRQTVVPVHAGETIGVGLLNKIMRDIELTRSQFLNLL